VIGADAHDTVRQRLAADDIDDDVRAHLAGCDSCANWQRRMTGMLATATALGTDHQARSESHVDQIANAVHADIRNRQRRRMAGFASVAAVAVLAIGVATLSTDDPAQDRLADVAAGYAANGTRFVFEASATVALPEMALVDDLQPVVLRTFPVCAAAPSPSTQLPTGADLSAVVDELLTAEPCVALSGLRSELGQRSQAAADALNLRAIAATQRIEQLTPLADNDDPLEGQSAQAAIAEAEQTREQAENDLLQLLAAHGESVDQLVLVADTANSGTNTGGFQGATSDSLRALAAVVDNTDTTSEPRDVVVWDTLSTGTWAPSGVALSGTATSDTGSSALFDDVSADPLALAQVLFADTDTLLAVLRSAPPAGGDTISWTVPVDVAAIAGADPLTAQATFTAAGLDRLQLSTRRGDGSIVTLTFIPAR
jgi:hypothetical protein